MEWKSEGDASEKKWRAELAQQVLGMANRDPDAAGAWFGGCAYVLLGVAPGELRGTRVHDSADIEKWLAPYVGRTPDGPEWTSTFPEIDGKHVLVLTIEPRNGVTRSGPVTRSTWRTQERRVRRTPPRRR